MAKLTKDEVKKHNEALRFLEKEKLTYDEKVYVYENWNEGADSVRWQDVYGLTRWYLESVMSVNKETETSK